MKQSIKKVYGIFSGVALMAGVAGAFIYSATANAMVSSGEQNATEEVPQVSRSAAAVGGPYIDLTDAAEKACNAVVYIKVVVNGKTQTVEYRDPFADFFGEFFGRGGAVHRRQIQTPKREAAGSGVIISSDGYIVTNNHVVENADEITITLNDNREFTARTIGTDPDTDLALLKIDGEDFPTLPIGDSDALKVGEWVLAVGNPFNLTSTVTAGIVSAKARSLGATRTGIESFIQTDAAINSGNSGGALVNARGELVGINAMLYSQTGSFTGYGFAIPTSIMKKVVEDLKQYGVVQRAMLGISGTDANKYIDAQKANDKEVDLGTVDGVYIAEVSEDGSAADAGLKEGDVIVSVNGKHVSKMSELQEMLTKFRPGDKVVIGYIRDKKEKSTNVTLRNSKGTTTVVKNNNMDILGADFVELSDDLKKTLNLSYGVQIKELRNGRMKDAGMTKGFIILKANNQNIRTVEDLSTAFKTASNSAEQTLWIWGKTPAGKSQSFAVIVGEE